MRCPNASVDVLLLLAPPWPATTPLMIVTTNATADRRNTLTDMYIATPNTTRMMPTYGAMAVATPMICSAIVTSGCGGRRVGGAAGAASGSDTDLAREVILAQPAIAAVPPRGLRGGLGLAVAAGLSLGGSSRALSLCGWPARCLLGVGVDALLA